MENGLNHASTFEPSEPIPTEMKCIDFNRTEAEVGKYTICRLIMKYFREQNHFGFQSHTDIHARTLAQAWQVKREDFQ